MADHLLDRLWTAVINLDPQGQWIEQAARASGQSGAPFSEVAAVLRRLTAAGASREDLGRIGRAERYEACFSTLYALDDPGPGRRKLSTLSALAEKAVAPSPRRRASSGEFSSELKRIMGVDEETDAADQAADLDDSIRRCQDDPQAPFADVGPALKRVTQCGATPADFAHLSSWHRYEACRLTLKLAGEAGFDGPEEVAGLHESLLGADPSGKDGRPGSWPVPVATPRPAHSGRLEDPTKPYLTIKSSYDFAFTTDSTGIMMGSKLCDVGTGEARLTCEAKGELRSCAFSPDGARSYHLVGDNGFIVCDLRTGRQFLKVRRRNAGTLRWFLVHPTTGEVLVQEIRVIRDPASPGSAKAAPPTYTLLDPLTLEPKRTLDLASGSSIGDHFAFSPDGLHIAGFWGTPVGPRPVPGMRVTAWRWPELTEEWDVPMPCRSDWSIAWSADSRRIAVGHVDVIVLDAVTGAEQLHVKPHKDCNHVDFSPDGKHIATGAHSGDRIQIWNSATGAVLHELSLPQPWCFQLSFSRDGKVLGASSHGVNYFWRFRELTAE